MRSERWFAETCTGTCEYGRFPRLATITTIGCVTGPQIRRPACRGGLGVRAGGGCRGVALAEPAAASAAVGLAGRAGDLGTGKTQARAELVDLELVDGALVAVAGFVAALLEPSHHQDPRALRQR